MAEETEVTETEIEDKPVEGILDAITDEPDKTLEGLDKSLTSTDEDIEAAETDTEAVTNGEEATADKTALTLPAAHIRSLKAYGWEDDEIQQNLEVLGDKFLSTAARIHKNRNDEVTSWAAAGRRARSEQNQTPVQTAKPGVDTGGLKPIDGDRLKAQYAEHELIDSLVGPYNQLLAEVQKMLPAVQETQKRSQQAELETLGKQIDSFFGSKELEPYTESYGTAERIDENQIGTRNKVLETADALMVGAKAQGRQLSLGEALTLAHDSVSGGLKQKVARTQIQEKLKTRQAGITLKPTAKGSTLQRERTVSSRAGLEKKVAAGLAAAFSDT